MVITNDVELPSYADLDERDVDVTSATLMAAGPYLGKYCEAINNEFMLCRMENSSPIPCIELGKLVTRCSMEFFQKMRDKCLHQHEQYANCIDKSSGSYKPWFCRKTHKIYAECISEFMCMDHPGFGYFTRARVHKSGCTDEAPEPPCPCLPTMGETTRSLPDCKPRISARYGTRSYWMTE